VQFLTKVELLRFLGVAKRERERDWLMFLVAYWHGLRASEVVHLKPDAIFDGEISVERLKGSEATIHPLIEDEEPLLSERRALETLAQNTPRTSPLFPFSRVHYFRLFRKYAKRAGINSLKWHPHTLKHSIARHNIEQIGIHRLKKYLGHKRMDSTGQYLKVTDQEASAAVARANGHKVHEPEE
jgi:integrase